jgi:serine/threonine protein kinase
MRALTFAADRLTALAAPVTHDGIAGVDAVEAALAEFLVRRESERNLRPSAYAQTIASAHRSAFVREARSLLALDDAFASARPQRVAGYRVLALLGEGGTARVFDAEHEASGRRVALKMLHRHLSQDAHSRARLCREARIAQSLSHPRIVPVLECGEADGAVFLVMERLHGTPLHRLLDAAGDVEAPVPLRARAAALLHDHRALARKFAAVADAVHAAHQQGVVHRDLKPSNLMVGEDSELTVLDFGLCSSPDARLTRSTDFLGTPIYMSPEQAAGHLEHMGPHSDIYSLGAVLYECVTGKPTVAAGSLPRVLDAVRGGRVPAAHRQAKVARPLSRILARCLEKNPTQRYASAADLAADLRAFADGRQPCAARAHARAQCVRWALLGALCLLAGFWCLRGGNRAAVSQEPAASLPAEVTRNLVKLARQGNEAQFARELQRVMQQD